MKPSTATSNCDSGEPILRPSFASQGERQKGAFGCQETVIIQVRTTMLNCEEKPRDHYDQRKNSKNSVVRYPNKLRGKNAANNMIPKKPPSIF